MPDVAVPSATELSATNPEIVARDVSEEEFETLWRVLSETFDSTILPTKAERSAGPLNGDLLHLHAVLCLAVVGACKLLREGKVTPYEMDTIIFSPPIVTGEAELNLPEMLHRAVSHGDELRVVRHLGQEHFDRALSEIEDNASDVLRQFGVANWGVMAWWKEITKAVRKRSSN